MTSYANPAVYQCPACQGLLLRERLRSFNTYGVTFWSDGDATFSRLPSHSPLIRCPSCTAVFWEDDLHPIGELPKRPLPQEPMGWFMRKVIQWAGDEHGDIQAQRDWDAAPVEWRAAEYVRTLEYGDLRQALAELQGQDCAREIYIRRRIWWLANDSRRIRASGKRAAMPPLVLRSKAREDMLRLLELHEQASSGIVDRAELLRQMGCFDEVVQLLASVPPDQIGVRGEKIRDWALAHDAELKMLGQAGY